MNGHTLTDSAAVNPLAPTIFHEEWWLDIACGGRAACAEVHENGRLIGRLPYVSVGRCASLRRIVMPLLTHFLGPAVAETEGSPPARLGRRIEITRELVAQLPRSLSTIIKCHAGVTDTIPFQMDGFKTSVQFTYEIAPQSDNDLWTAMRSPRRTIIRGAQRQCTVERLEDAAAFMRFYDDNLCKTGKCSFLDSAQSVRLIEAALQRGRGEILEARKADGSLAAAVFCVWDARASYYLMTTRDPSSHSGAVSLLAFEAMKAASARGLIFDLDGLSDDGGVAFFTGFGGVVAPRYIVTRESPAMKLYRSVRSALGKDSTYA